MLTIDHESDVPLVEQIVRGIRIAIASGQLPKGTELPPVRQLANDLAVNLNTVSRAYQLLDGCGLVHTARGRGTRVTGSKESPLPPKLRSKTQLAHAFRCALADAKLAGLKQQEIEAILQRESNLFWNAGSSERRA